MKAIADRWNGITKKEGKDEQQKSYAASLNIER
jgi:hypothetical protein